MYIPILNRRFYRMSTNGSAPDEDLYEELYGNTPSESVSERHSTTAPQVENASRPPYFGNPYREYREHILAQLAQLTPLYSFPPRPFPMASPIGENAIRLLEQLSRINLSPQQQENSQDRQTRDLLHITTKKIRGSEIRLLKKEAMDFIKEVPLGKRRKPL